MYRLFYVSTTPITYFIDTPVKALYLQGIYIFDKRSYKPSVQFFIERLQTPYKHLIVLYRQPYKHFYQYNDSPSQSLSQLSSQPAPQPAPRKLLTSQLVRRRSSHEKASYELVKRRRQLSASSPASSKPTSKPDPSQPEGFLEQLRRRGGTKKKRS